MRGRLCAIAAAIALMPACASSSSHEVAAVITNPTPASRAELRLAVQRALHSDPVLLADDALTQSNLLSIDRIVRRDMQGRPLNGLNTGTRPQQFRLVRFANSCVLIHEDAELLHQTLHSATCAPLSGRK